MRVADLLVRRLAELGLDTCFLVTGGGAMHLNDAFGAEPRFTKVACHHEQSCAIAAEGYARIARRPAVVNVTTGPGGINALNGVFGAFTDSIPMVVVSGQVKRETHLPLNPVPGLRQLGDQEVDILAMVAPITKARFRLSDPSDVFAIVDEAVASATRGRPGPVWIDVPVDVQGAPAPERTGPSAPSAAEEVPGCIDESILDQLLDAILAADRPVVVAGTGVRLAGIEGALLAWLEAIRIPVVTAWTHDLLPSDHPLFAGRPGTIGTRGGNFVVQSADLVVVLGSRLNIRQTSYNWASFARSAKKIWVDVDPAELRKPFVVPDLPIVADLAAFVPALARRTTERGLVPRHEAWIDWCTEVRRRFEPKPSDYPVRPGVLNAYHFVWALFEALENDDVVVSGDATACIVPFQVGAIRGSQRLFSNSGSASMGYDVPAALGASVALAGRRVICLAGDGSVMMNLQEFATIAGRGSPIKTFVLDNGGYLSIKQTQRNFFGREIGSSPASGVHFPDFRALGLAFGIPTITLAPDDVAGSLRRFLDSDGPGICVVPLDPEQEFEPRLKSRMVGGTIHTPELDDMYPFLDPRVVEEVRESARSVRATRNPSEEPQR